MNPKILIAGATGATGRVATQLLLEKRFPVRALVHKEDERSTKLKEQGAEIVVGDLLDLRAVRRAFDEVQRAYFVYPMRPGLTEATAHFAEAALEAKTEFIVKMSQKTSRPDAISDSALHHRLAERVVDWAGRLSPIFVRPSSMTGFSKCVKASLMGNITSRSARGPLCSDRR
jgi:NAD(P)H dehydrogenase (quinone)